MYETVTACPSCGHEIRSGMLRCRNCGTKVVDAAPPLPPSPTAPKAPEGVGFSDMLASLPDTQEGYCPSCGEETRPGMLSCRHCGHRFIGEAPPAPAKARENDADFEISNDIFAAAPPAPQLPLDEAPPAPRAQVERATPAPANRPTPPPPNRAAARPNPDLSPATAAAPPAVAAPQPAAPGRKSGSLDDVAAFLEPLKNPDPAARRGVIDKLEKRGSEAAVDVMIQLLRDPDETVRQAAADAFGRLRNPRTVSPLSKVLPFEHCKDVTLAIIRALGRIGDPKALTGLAATLRDEPTVRCQACIAVGEIGTAAALEILVPMVKDPTPEVRHHAAMAIGRVGDAQGLPALKDLLADRDPFVLRGAVMALELMRGPEAAELLETARQKLKGASSSPAPAPASVAAPVPAPVATTFASPPPPQPPQMWNRPTQAPSAPPRPSSTPKPPRRARESIDWRPMLKPGLAIAGCLLLAGGIWWMQNRTPPAVTKKTGSVKQTTGKLQRAPAAASAPSEGSAFERE